MIKTEKTKWDRKEKRHPRGTLMGRRVIKQPRQMAYFTYKLFIWHAHLGNKPYVCIEGALWIQTWKVLGVNITLVGICGISSVPVGQNMQLMASVSWLHRQQGCLFSLFSHAHDKTSSEWRQIKFQPDSSLILFLGLSVHTVIIKCPNGIWLCSCKATTLEWRRRSA